MLLSIIRDPREWAVAMETGTHQDKSVNINLRFESQPELLLERQMNQRFKNVRSLWYNCEYCILSCFSRSYSRFLLLLLCSSVTDCSAVFRLKFGTIDKLDVLSYVVWFASTPSCGECYRPLVLISSITSVSRSVWAEPFTCAMSAQEIQ